MPGQPPTVALAVTLSNRDVSQPGNGAIQGFSEPENDRLYLLGVRDLTTGVVIQPDVNGSFLFTQMTGGVVDCTVLFSDDLTYTITPGLGARVGNKSYFNVFEFSVGDDAGAVDVIASNGTLAAPGEHLPANLATGANTPPSTLAATGTVTENSSAILISSSVGDPEGFPVAPTYQIDPTGTLCRVIDNGDGSGGASPSSTSTVTFTNEGQNDLHTGTPVSPHKRHLLSASYRNDASDPTEDTSCPC